MLLRLFALTVLLMLGGCGKSADELLSAARALQEKGDRAGAILQVKSLLQEHPEHMPSRLFLGQLYLESADYAGAEKELRRALDGNADPALALPALARVLVMQGEAKKVLAEVDPARVSDSAAVARILAARGTAHMLLRQNEEAKAAFAKALSVQAGAPEALVGQARMLAGERRLEEALAEVERALAAHPKEGDALMLKGDLLRAAGKTAEAEAVYKALVEAHPEHVAGLLALVSMSVGGNRLDEAAKYLATARKAAPGNAMVTYFQALIAFRRNDFKAARDAIGAVLKVAPNHLPSVLLGGAVEFALGSQELAQTRLRFVLERAPGNLYARRVLAASYTRAGQTQKALEVLEPALKAGVKDPAILALAGEAYMQLNDFERARELFQQASTLDPKNARMRTGVGLSRLAAGDVEAATAELESASQLDTSRNQADVLLVTTYLQRRQFDQALKAAQALVSKQPDSPVGYNLTAAAHLGRRDEAAARAALQKALEVQPTYVPAASNLAQLDLKAGDKKSARKRFEDIIGRDKTSMQAYLALAAFGPQIDASREEILKWLEAARRENPGAIQPLVLLARNYLQANEPKRAMDLVDKALAGAANNPEILELAGQVQLEAGEKNRALTTFLNWVGLQPSAKSFYRLATAQLANEEVDAAIKSLRSALEHRTNFHEARVLLAESEARAGRTADALKTALALQQQNARSPAGWIVEGDVHMRAKQHGQALKAYEKAQTIAPGGSIVLRMHAALAAEGRGSEGETRIADWLKRNANDQGVRLAFAEVLLRAGRNKEASEQYELLAKQVPDNVVVLNNLAWTYMQLKDKRAIETAEKALALRPDSPEIMDTLGWGLVEAGQVDRGLGLLKKAAERAPRSPAIRFHFAQALHRSGDAGAAKRELERLLVDFPAFAERAKALEYLEQLRKG